MENNHVIVPGFNLPPYWLKGKVVILNSSNNTVSFDDTTLKVVNQFPLTLKADDVEFTFPTDPFISTSFKDIITRRSVAKGKARGTVKEHWTEDDVEISIFGVFISSDGNYPVDIINKLHELRRKKTSIKVSCELLNEIGITYMVIESFDLPFTKGIENQTYEIKAYSDDIFDLLEPQKP